MRCASCPSSLSMRTVTSSVWRVVAHHRLVATFDRDDERGVKANRPTAPGLGQEHGPARRETGDARLRDPLDVSKIRTDSVANLAVSETAPRKRAR